MYIMSLSFNQDFIGACIDNNINLAKEIYSKNIININEIKHDTETSDIQGPYSLFECMCIKNHMEIVKWFIELGTNPSPYINGFISACQYNHLELVEYLFDNVIKHSAQSSPYKNCLDSTPLVLILITPSCLAILIKSVMT